MYGWIVTDINKYVSENKIKIIHDQGHLIFAGNAFKRNQTSENLTVNQHDEVDSPSSTQLRSK